MRVDMPYVNVYCSWFSHLFTPTVTLMNPGIQLGSILCPRLTVTKKHELIGIKMSRKVDTVHPLDIFENSVVLNLLEYN